MVDDTEASFIIKLTEREDLLFDSTPTTQLTTMSKGFSEEEVAQFQETFNMYDADGGGK
jgi:hypothetical protein